MAEQNRSELIATIAEGYVDARCLHVAVALGVADAVRDEPRPIGEVAVGVGADPTALYRVLRHLTSIGVFAMSGDTIVHNAASRLLRSDDPGGMFGLVRLLGLPVIWDSFAELEHAVRTGRPGTEARYPEGFFAYLESHPAEALPYNEGMTAMTERRLPKILPFYDFSPYAVIADIGGGRGHLLRAVMEQTPGARGVLFDRASVVQTAEPHERVSVHAGDFFVDALPAADCYILSNIIHDWGDAEAVSILRAVRTATHRDSRLLLFEFVVEDTGEFEASDIDVFMLALVTGSERTEVEYAGLLGAAGFELVRAVPTDNQSILEARPV